MNMDLAIIERAVRELAEREPFVAAAYLHGSAATGRMDGESDIDIALLATHACSHDERWELRLCFIGALMKKFPSMEEKFDVIVLQDVPVLLRYNVLRRGRPLFERMRADRLDFEVTTEREYDDEAPYLERETSIILQRIIRSARP